MFTLQRACTSKIRAWSVGEAALAALPLPFGKGRAVQGQSTEQSVCLPDMHR